MPDPNRVPAPDTLPGRLGLTEGQMEIAQRAIEEALAGPVTMTELRGALKAVLHGVDDPEIGITEAVTRELENWDQLLYIGIAYRAFAKGLQTGQGAADAEPQPATSD